MAGVIDVRDLPDEEVKFIQKLVDLLREKSRTEKTREKKGEEGDREEVNLTAHPSKVIGKISRKEIYDYL